MTRLLAILLLAFSSLASAQLKSLPLGRITYIGESTDGTTSFFTIKSENSNLALPLTFQTIKLAIAGAKGSLGSVTATGPWTTPTEILVNDTTQAPINGHPCPCLVAAFQLSMSSDPSVTITLKNGESITTSSIVNVYLQAPFGKSAIQLQQYVPIVVHALP